MFAAHLRRSAAVGCLVASLSPNVLLAAQVTPQVANRAPAAPATPPATSTPAAPAAREADAKSVTPPAGYVIGPEDVLGIVYWREKDLSAEVVVRPDGIITLPLLEDMRVVGLTPAELKQKITTEAGKLVTSPTVSVVVKQINSRKVFITGHVARPGSYPLISPMNVVQLIALSGGLLEFADRSKIRVMRNTTAGTENYKVNYKQLANGEDMKQNIDLRPGDTVIVP